MKSLALSFCVLGLVSCASITAVPLKVDGAEAKNVVDGIRYYLPKPYLLVARLPASVQSSEAGKSRPGEPPQDGSSTENPAKKDEGEEGNGKEPGASSEAGNSSTFHAATASYVIKLVYLPDYRSPMALRMSTGLFGSVTFKPTLESGWMLTALDSSADSKVPEAITALGSVLGAKAAKSSADTSGGAGGEDQTVLRPGLYEFVYDSNGVFLGLRRMADFTSSGVNPDVGKL